MKNIYFVAGGCRSAHVLADSPERAIEIFKNMTGVIKVFQCDCIVSNVTCFIS